MNVPIPCICPGKPHSADQVTLRDTLDFRRSVALRDAILVFRRDNPDADEAELLAALAEAYLIHGVEAWTLVDESGAAVAVSRTSIRDRLLSEPEIAMTVSDEADQLYKGKVVGPLASWISRFSPPTQTDESTSPKNGSTPEPPMPLRPSWTSTTQTDDTEPTSWSLAGVSN